MTAQVSSLMTNKPSICLNMIVKNESAVIERCLNSVKDMISYWVICDTGSTDGTQDIIRNFCEKEGIAGELWEDPWENFEHNRNLALQRALGKADYVFIIDADDFMESVVPEEFMALDGDAYLVNMLRFNITYGVTKLLKSSMPWRWEGIIHEYLVCDAPYTLDHFKGQAVMRSLPDGARSQNPNKYADDAKVLEKAVEKEPDNTRYQFYLGRSYFDAGDFHSALKSFERRIEMGGWEEEVFYSMLEIGRCQEALDYPQAVVVEAYLKAFTYRPARLEALYEAVRFCRIHDLFHMGYMLSAMVQYVKAPNDILFVANDIYEWRLLDEISLCAIYAGDKSKAQNLISKLVRSPLTPPDQMERLQRNLTFCE